MSNPSPDMPSPPRQARRSQGAEDEEGTPAPIVACRRCRKQKLRCSRDLPSCKRCRDLSTVCEYPPPPDRKLLAAQRWQNAKARAHRESVGSQSSQDQRKLPIVGGKLELQRATSTQDFHQDANPSGAAASYDDQDQSSLSNPACPLPSAPPLQASLTRTTLPSTEVANFLIEIYFSHLLNSGLIFHKKSFLADFAAKKVPDFLALSIFCLATIFLRKEPGKIHPRQDTDEDGVYSGYSLLSTDLGEQGREWALAGTQRVLMQCDMPSVATIQACQNIALYWFAVGRIERTDMHSYIAFQTARALRLNVGQDSSAPQTLDPVSAEVQRRCYWAAWLGNAVDKYSQGDEPAWHQVSGLLFPSHDNSFDEGNPVAQHCFDEKGNIISTVDEPIQMSLLGGLVTFFSLWTEIRRFVKKYEDSRPEDFAKRIASLLELDSQIGRALELLHPDARASNINDFVSAKGNDAYRLFWLHGLHRICACTLHSSLVPLYSNNPPHPQVGKNLVRLSAEEVVKHAASTLDMATAFLSTNPDVARLPSTTGYAMFVAVTLHFKSIVAQRKLRNPGVLSRFKAALYILDRLKMYWSTIGALWSRLETLFDDSGVNIQAVFEIDLQQNEAEEQPQPADIDKIVTSKESPKDSGDTDFSNFAAGKTKSDSMRRRSLQHSQRKNSGNSSPSPKAAAGEPTSIPNNPNNLAQRSRSHSDVQNQHAGPKMYSSPPPQANIPSQTPYSQPTPSHQWSNYTTSQSPPQYTHVPGSMTSEYMPLGTVAEDYEMQGHAMGQGHMGGMQGMNQYGDYGMMNTEMDLDRMNFWWDQSYVPFDASMEQQPQLQPDPRNPQGQGHGQVNYGMFSFG